MTIALHAARAPPTTHDKLAAPAQGSARCGRLVAAWRVVAAQSSVTGACGRRSLQQAVRLRGPLTPPPLRAPPNRKQSQTRSLGTCQLTTKRLFTIMSAQTRCSAAARRLPSRSAAPGRQRRRHEAAPLPGVPGGCEAAPLPGAPRRLRGCVGAPAAPRGPPRRLCRGWRRPRAEARGASLRPRTPKPLCRRRAAGRAAAHEAYRPLSPLFLIAAFAIRPVFGSSAHVSCPQPRPL